MELGVFTFAPLKPSLAEDGEAAARRMRELLEEIELADQVGLDVFGVGEHHRPDYVVSSPAIVLAAAAARTKTIRLSSAVSVISSDDPIRVFQDFATVDLISGGRAEIMAGRGSFTESFPLFGFDLHDYDELFAEKLQLLIAARDQVKLTWPGTKHTPRVEDRGVYPRPVQERLPIWIAVGGNPESAVRAGVLGLPMAIAIIGGMPERFAPFAEVHREAARRAGHGPLALSINSHGYIADTKRQAIDESYAASAEVMNRIGRERGWPPMTLSDYEASAELRMANFIGAPEDIVEKILFQHEVFGHDRFNLQISVGPLPHEKVLRSIELFGTKVAPVVRDEVRRRTAESVRSV